ncbi:DNA polymerase III [Streptomyces sp. HNM0575]|uniref:TerD family protein n=1 Tax=Streptomyces sp. HNM0575 TaxID=2716338 RepID=UPI00145FA433|nr:TerD family protein [Streptomyces sp. HNM0575]NLU76188.1 DNA polymerase III [Streptomyces sp. HNM0575]
MSLPAVSVDASNSPSYAHDWALVDVETSGLIPRQHRVLSIAVVTVDADGTQSDEFSTLLNPGCDPGPVRVHGLTAGRLRGAPRFEQIVERVAPMLRNRVFVAHNAQFDYDFLAHEFARARSWLPVSQRLCTLALNRQMDPPTNDLRLGTLAAHYGIRQLRAHEALDDTRVLAGMFKGSLQEAARLGVPLPLVACPPRQDAQFVPQPPKTPCEFTNPGRLSPAGLLTQGMKVAVTGDTSASRPELVARAVAAGLNVMTSVSRHTSVLVTNDQRSDSAKALRARAEGVPVIDESTFLRLLEEVQPGTRHDQQAAVGPARQEPTPAPPGEEHAPVPAASVSEEARRRPTGAGELGTQDRPLAGRRVLILGGTHPTAAAARARVVEMGGAAAINFSAGVTDVVSLAGGDADRRMRRIAALNVPTHGSDWLKAPVVESVSGARFRRSPLVLPRGGVVDLPYPFSMPFWTVTGSWARQDTCEVDLVAFILDEDDQVSRDENFVFYGAPESPDGTVRLLSDGPSEQTIVSSLPALPPAARKVVIAAAIDGAATFGDVGAVQVTTGPSSSAAPLAQAVLDAATTERTMILAEIYRRGPLWRFRAVGQGYGHGLHGLAEQFGVDVAD